MAVNTEEVAKATAEIEAATTETTNESSEDIVKSLVSVVDRLTKAGKFGDTDKAHNGNKYDKSGPLGDGKASDGYDSVDEEEDPDNAKERVSNSVSRSRGKTDAMPTKMNKGEGDDDLEKSEDEDEEAPAEKSFSGKALTEERVYERIAKGEGAAADDYRQVVDASDAIQYLTDELVKAQVHISKQIEQNRDEMRKALRAVRRMQTDTLETQVALAKSLAFVVKEQERLSKSEVKNPKTDGRVTVVKAVEAAGKTVLVDKGILAKSITAGIASGKVDEREGANVMANLDTVGDINAYWQTLPASFRQAVDDAMNATA